MASGADCIYKMEYDNGSWTITPGYDNGGICGQSPATPVFEEGMEGDGVMMEGDPALPADGSVPPPPPVSDAPPIFGPPAGAPTN